jgi:hypothetical protein
MTVSGVTSHLHACARSHISKRLTLDRKPDGSAPSFSNSAIRTLSMLFLGSGKMFKDGQELNAHGSGSLHGDGNVNAYSSSRRHDSAKVGEPG